MLILLALLAAVGMSHILVDGSILASWRGRMVQKYKDSKPWVLELISCYMCNATHSGALMGLLLQPISWNLFNYLPFWWAFGLSLPLWFIVTPFVFGMASSYLSMYGAALLNYLEAPGRQNAQSKT